MQSQSARPNCCWQRFASFRKIIAPPLNCLAAFLLQQLCGNALDSLGAGCTKAIEQANNIAPNPFVHTISWPREEHRIRPENSP